MTTVYETLTALTQGQYARPVGKLALTEPKKVSEERQVVTNWDRGGFSRAVKVNTDPDVSKAQLYVTELDVKTRNLVKDQFDFTSFVVAILKGERFQLVNGLFEARLSRETYEALVDANIARPGQDLSKLVLLDFRGAPIFPEAEPNAQYVEDKLRLLELQARLKKLRSIKAQARNYFKKHGITFPELEAYQGRSETGNVAVPVPYTRYEVLLPTETITPLVNSANYRNEGTRPYEYYREAYIRLKADIEEVKSLIGGNEFGRGLAQRVRVAELGMLEHLGNFGERTVEVKGKPVLVKQVLSEDVEKHYTTPELAGQFLNLSGPVEDAPVEPALV